MFGRARNHQYLTPQDPSFKIAANSIDRALYITDLPFTVQGQMSRRHAEGALGAGGPAIELETVNGSIEIR